MCGDLIFKAIKEGYRVIFVSWENDADNYRALALDGLTDIETQMYVELATLFTHSYHKSADIQYYGNMSDDDYEELSECLFEDVMKILEQYKYATPAVAADIDTIKKSKSQQDAFDDIMCGYFSKIYGSRGDEFFRTRVVESIKVVYIPQSLEFEDVTHHFLPKEE